MAGDASEQSLQDLIAEAKNINATLIKLSSVLGKTAAGGGKAAPSIDGAAKTINDMGAGMSKVLPLMGPAGVALKVVAVAAEAVGKVFSMLGGLISGLFSGLANVAGILGDFAMTVSKGEMKVSDLVGVMGKLAEQVPIVGGALSALFGLFKIATQRQEENLEIYRQITQVGAGVGGSLTEMRTFIRDTGLTLQEFAGAVQKHSTVMATGAGSTDAGMKLFAKGMKELNNTNSEAGNKMRGLGLTTEQMSDSMALYMLTQGTMNKRGLEDGRAAATGAANLAEQMTFLSEVTGKRKDQIVAEIKEAAEEANWKNFLSGLDPAEAERATKLQAEAQIRGGKDLGDAMKLAIRTGITTPVTEGGKRIFIATNGMSEELLKSGADFVKNKNMTDAEGDTIMGLGYRKLGVAATEQAKNFGTAGAVLDTQGKSLTNQNLLNLGIAEKSFKTDAESLANREKLRKQNDAAGSSEAQSLATRQQQLKNFGAQIDNIISGLFAPFLGPVMNMVDKFMGGAEGAVDKFKPLIDALTIAGTTLANWMDKIINRFANIKNVDEFWAEVKNTLKEVWAWMKPAIMSLWESVKPTLLDAVGDLFSSLFKMLFNKLTFGLFEGSASSQASGGAVAGVSQTGEVDLSGGNSETAPSNPDNSKVARDWAWSMMTGQNAGKNPPASIKDQVEGIMANDSGLKQQADNYKAAAAKQAEEAKRKASAEEAAAKKANDQASQQDSAKPAAAAPVAAQESKGDPIAVLNSNIERLIRTNLDVAENTKATVRAIANQSDLFKRA